MIIREFPALVFDENDLRRSNPVTITLSYDQDYDPLAVQLIASVSGQEDAVWYFSRDLLIQGVGSHRPVGSGDVRLRFTGTELLVCLMPPHGHADLGLPHGEVVAFLEETFEEVEPGCEILDGLIDEAIEEMLNG